jgi:hypothetical protein
VWRYHFFVRLAQRLDGTPVLLLPMRSSPFSLGNKFLVAGIAAGILVLGGCSGEDDSSSSADEGTTSVQEGGEETATDPAAVDVPEGFDVPEGVPLADGLIPELAEIPLPVGPVVFEVGVAYDAATDPRETASQRVHFTISPQEVLDFYYRALPEAKFMIDSEPVDAVAGQQTVIEFTDPDGLPGRIFVSSGAWSDSQININLFRSGTS